MKASMLGPRGPSREAGGRRPGRGQGSPDAGSIDLSTGVIGTDDPRLGGPPPAGPSSLDAPSRSVAGGHFGGRPPRLGDARIPSRAEILIVPVKILMLGPVLRLVVVCLRPPGAIRPSAPSREALGVHGHRRPSAPTMRPPAMHEPRRPPTGMLAHPGARRISKRNSCCARE